jgi:hypothetical protein
MNILLFILSSLINKHFRRAKFEAELKAMQWLIKWEELTTRTLLHNGVATPSFNKLSASQKVNLFRIVVFYFILFSFKYFSGFISTEVSEYVSVFHEHFRSESSLSLLFLLYHSISTDFIAALK